MYTRDFDDLARIINIADAFLAPELALRKKPTTAAFRVDSDASPKAADAPPQGAPAAKRRRFAVPSFDWDATDTGVVLHAATPGLKKEDLSINIVEEAAQRYLVVSGGTNDPANPDSSVRASTTPTQNDSAATAASPCDASNNKANAPTSHLFYAPFEHRMRVSSGVTSECLTAKYEDGVLTVHLTLPKERPPTSETIAIA